MNNIKVEKQFLTQIYRCNVDNNPNNICYNFAVTDEKNNMHDFYMMCIHVFKSIINNRLKLYNIKNITNDPDFNSDLEILNVDIDYLLCEIENDKKQYIKSKMDINDYIIMRDRKNKIEKILYGNQ